jgi:monoterpene epsilon-lactone hydrolase
MSSLKSRLVYFLLRNRHLLKFHLQRESWDWNTSISEFRQECESGAKRGKLPDGIDVESVSAAGLRAEWILPRGATKDKIILYTMGGGYVSGSCSDHRSLVAKIVKGSGIGMLLFEHRLAPEHPYPAALEDSVSVYQWLLEQGVSPSGIVIAGESAGGGLGLATLLALRDRGIPLPAAGVAISPWTDLALTGESYRTRLNSSIDPPGMSMVCSKYYVGDHDPYLPGISPLYGDLHGLPPLFICVGTYETMLDDSLRFAEKAKVAGVEVTLKVGEKMIHCFPLMAPLFPEATEALHEICSFIRTSVNRNK